MPTVPAPEPAPSSASAPEPSPPSGNEPHRHRLTAESFGTDAERYDRVRPRYPEALVERIVAACPGPEVLDAGCGTGIAARQFQAAGCRVLGVEPDERMAVTARRSGVETELAAFETWDRAGRQFDAVVSGQAWHWIDPVAGAAQACRVLRPDGLLALFWNVFRLPPALAESFAAACRRVMPDSPVDLASTMSQDLDSYSPLIAKAVEGIGGTGGFGAAEQWRFDWERSYTRDTWLDQMPTFGLFTRLPAARLAGILEGVGAAVDAVGGGFTMRYATVAVVARRGGAV
ncbi:class I SAM-dependent methyltransferase [Streptomyces marispadix]|uniref:Class I SAM-dependent methyltransferase n=1 Tax=Streptomyces marispadix TaxID=2922868 RepID=A0ABS9SXL9_9ACTN|nr:class I SAM-dependent methyltransferase [Streptomyces marispadix]MCH6161028.1 class I SAM-dependent methyltransferase [Streptomyces marispadix]